MFKFSDNLKSTVKKLLLIYTKNKLLIEKTAFFALLLVFVYSVFSIGSILFDYHTSRRVNAEIREIFHSQDLYTEESSEEFSRENESLAHSQESDQRSDITLDSPNSIVTDESDVLAVSDAPLLSESAANLQSNAVAATQEAIAQEPQAEAVVAVPVKPRMARKAFSELLEINEDVVGWLRINNTRVDYPVLQADDNEFYMNRNIHRERARGGSIFMDFRNDIQKPDHNTIIYGHNMRDSSKLTDIVNYKNERFFLNHPYVNFDTLYENQKWVVFSVYVTDVSFNYLITNFRNEEAHKIFLETIKSKSMFSRGVEVLVTDRILTLSTCSYEFENARTVVHAKLID